jgi:pimeloyl-ACP methyl ester carboxylesterase
MTVGEHVILLHGIWMRGFTLGALARRLRAEGYTIDLFEYASVARGVLPFVAPLRERMLSVPGERVHLIGHSLGGLLALEATRDATDLPAGHVVCLGSPLKGSRAAQRLGHWPVGRWLTGSSHDLLCAGVAAWNAARPVGVIAGRLPYGLGVLVEGLPSPHDGTVAVDETRLDGIADHCVVAATHTGLLFSTDAARQIVHFLRAGRFALGP